MCTAVSYMTECHYFGRNLDFEHSFSETVTVTPRHFKFNFHFNGSIDAEYNTPVLYDEYRYGKLYDISIRDNKLIRKQNKKL